MTPDPSLNINGYSFTSILTNSSKACAAAINSVLRASEDISITNTLYSNFPLSLYLVVFVARMLFWRSRRRYYQNWRNGTTPLRELWKMLLKLLQHSFLNQLLHLSKIKKTHKDRHSLVQCDAIFISDLDQ